MNVYSPEAYKSIPLIREALKQGDYKEPTVCSVTYRDISAQNYQPLGQLAIEYLDTTLAVTNYGVGWTCDTAAHTEYRLEAVSLYSKEYFATIPTQELWCVSRQRVNPKGIQVRLSLSCQLQHHCSIEDGNTLVTDGYAGYASLCPANFTMRKRSFAYDPERGIHFRRE